MEKIERLPNSRETRFRFVVHSHKGKPPTFDLRDCLTDTLVVEDAPSIRDALAQAKEQAGKRGKRWRQTAIEP